jgi:hypothetical protein
VCSYYPFSGSSRGRVIFSQNNFLKCTSADSCADEKLAKVRFIRGIIYSDLEDLKRLELRDASAVSEYQEKLLRQRETSS